MSISGSYLFLFAGSLLMAQGADSTAIPSGTQISIRTLDRIESKQAEVGHSYRCSIDSPIVVSGKELVSKGSDCTLRITETKNAGKLSGSNELKLVVSEIKIGGNFVSVDTDPKDIKGKGKGKSSGVKTGLGAAAGAGLGALIGGGKGAAIGAGVGAGAGAASSGLTHGPEIKVSPETVLAFVIR